jgi:DNA-binding response OmpR family regulator
MGSLLIIDDDVDLCAMLQAYLGDHGLRLTAQHDAYSGLHAVSKENYDLLLLDVMLPGFDGFTVLRKLRASSQIGVIMLTARAHEHDRIHGFDAGADDYVAKPFNAQELLGRIHAILRRSGATSGSANPARQTTAALNMLRLVPSTRQVIFRERTWQLTETEFLLLHYFLQAQGTVISRDDIVAKVFQRDFHPFDRSLDMHISRLRKKLETMGCPPDWLRTVRNSGYLFTYQSAVA